MMFNIFFFKLLIFNIFLLAATQKSVYKFLGCYSEENLISLGDESRVLTSVSPQSCSEFCHKKQYSFFILKNDICYCSKNYISKLMRYFNNACSKKCSGDNSTSCGGSPNLVSLYTTDQSLSNSIGHGSYPIGIYLGCYSETPEDGENRLLKGPAQPYNNNTPQRCSEICFKQGYLYFGVTYGSECWCGNQKPSKSVKVEDKNCDSLCSGDNKQFCGGGWKMGVFSTGITDHPSKKYVGCFDEDEKNHNGKRVSFQMGANNSPKRCMNLCNTQRFKYAAIKGDVCECKNHEMNLKLKRSFSDCNTLCQENPSEYCGGKTTTSVYKTQYPDSQRKNSLAYIGCFNNLKRHPVLDGWKITISNLTPYNCANNCFTRGYPYAALVSSKECICSYTKPSNEALTEDNSCAIPCPGSSQQSCGGNNAISVYGTGLESKTDAVGNYYLGCFEENENNRIYNSFSRSYSKNTPEFCSNLCYKMGYTYMGVTYKSECFCGSQTPSTTRFNKLEDKQCNTKCSGDANQFCGGGWRMGVFATGLRDFPIEGRYVGCFAQQENVLNNIKFELINTNMPSKCSTICNDAGYQFAGVVGINCFCGSRAPNSNQQVSDSDCDTTCVGDATQTCGGEDRIQIYDLLKQVNDGEPVVNEVVSNNLNEEFDNLNSQTLWNHDVYIPQEPDFDFVVFNNSERNSFVKNGELIIKPIILPDSFVRRGCISFKECTRDVGCAMNASSYNIIPPIVSAKLTTKNNVFFLYGQLEVVAKLPSGDWIVPEIALVSKSNEQNRLVLATLFGNNDLKCNGNNEGSTVLKYGMKIDKQYHVNSNLMKSTSANRWCDDYHSFVLSWTPGSIVFKIDEENNYLDTTNLPIDMLFDSEYYLSIGLSVGGMTNFPDGCLSNGRVKPWKNLDIKGMLNFWKDKDHWASTWDDEKSTLRIRSIKFTPQN